MIKILQPHEIRQPSRGLVLDPEGWEGHPLAPLGATEENIGAYYKDLMGDSYQIYFPNQDSSPYLKDFQFQRNSIFDPCSCVLCSTMSGLDIIENRKFGNELPPQSRRRQAVKAGVKPGLGTSNVAGEQSIIKYGMVPESAYPSMTPTMTQDEYFKDIPDEVDAQEDFKTNYDFKPWRVPTRDGVSALPQYLGSAALVSPIRVTVCGTYGFDQHGRLIRTSNLIVDSENPNGFIKVAPEYDFHYPTFFTLEKKNLMQFYQSLRTDNKVITPRTILTFGKVSKKYLAWPSGDVFKEVVGEYPETIKADITDDMVARNEDGTVKCFSLTA